MNVNNYEKYEPIDGKWHITKELGNGSFGKVFEMERKDYPDIKAALKVVSIPSNPGEVQSFREENYDLDDKSVTSYFYGFVEEFVNEFKLMSMLKGHSNIVSYEDHDVKKHENEVGWDIFIRMELLTPMNKYFADHKATTRDIIKLGIDICKALELCQKYKIIHRDIKPSNIFVSATGDFKLGDFGVARTLEKTSSGLSKKGTYTYMAPEVFKGEEYGSNVDIYSLGIVLYKLLNNNLEPFRTDRTHTDEENALCMRMKGEKIPKPANADPKLAAIILKACAFDPKDRYPDSIQMGAELRDVLYKPEIINKTDDEKDFADQENTTFDDSEDGGTVSMFSHDSQKDFFDDNKKTEDGFSSTYASEKDENNARLTNKIIYCPKCGLPNTSSETERFCKNCGFGFTAKDKQVKNLYEAAEKRSIKELYIDFWSKCFDFKGCTSRRDFWITFLLNLPINVVMIILTQLFAPFGVFCLAMLIPSLAIGARRLHDVGKSGHWQWLYLTVYGSIVPIVFLCMETKYQNKKYI